MFYHVKEVLNMESLTFYQILCLIGVPSIATVIGWIYTKFKKNEEETNAVKLGIQALLRSQMIADYNRWSDKGYVPIYARENFENCWRQYHELGANGVMNDIHKKFINLPTSPKKEKNTEKKQENNAKGGR